MLIKYYKYFHCVISRLWHGKIKKQIQRLCTEDKKLARLLNLLLSEWLVEVRDAIIYHCPQAAGHGIDSTKFPRTENSCGTLGIRRHEVEPSNLTDGCPAICNKPGHVHTATWDGRSARRICRQITLFWRPGTTALRSVDINIDDWTGLSIPSGMARTRVRFAAFVIREIAEFMKSPTGGREEYRNGLLPLFFRGFPRL